jgi:AraC-like DNA-binding protein/mannose-6-phosphate isomerase-like protein (cupin superfamily)
MIETPSSFAGAPDHGEHDVLAEMLRAVRLTGSVYLNACFTAPFGIVSPKHFDGRTPMAHLRHVSIFHLISAGECSVELATGEQRKISAGDILLMPFADTHKFWNGRPAELAAAVDVVRPGRLKGMWNINHGGGGQETRMICGFIESSEVLLTPVFRTLPPLLVERTEDDQASALIASTVRQIIVMTENAAPGTELMLGRLMELLFVEVVRRYAASLPPSAKGWFAALNEPVVGRALQFMHREPARRWTVDDLAHKAGSSRTVLAERFQAVLGQAPIEYLTSWRMQLAAERLRAGAEGLAVIAADVGYDSEAAFNRAFKRVTGVTPGRWRDSASPAAGVVMGAKNADA